MEKRNRYTSEFKAKVVLELLREESTLAQVASKYQLNPQMLSQWKSEFVKNASTVFEKGKDEAGKLQKEWTKRKPGTSKIIGQMSYEIDWLEKKIWSQIARQKQEKQWLSRATGKSICPIRLSCSASTEPAYTEDRQLQPWAELDLFDMRINR